VTAGGPVVTAGGPVVTAGGPVVMAGGLGEGSQPLEDVDPRRAARTRRRAGACRAGSIAEDHGAVASEESDRPQGRKERPHPAMLPQARRRGAHALGTPP